MLASHGGPIHPLPIPIGLLDVLISAFISASIANLFSVTVFVVKPREFATDGCGFNHRYFKNRPLSHVALSQIIQQFNNSTIQQPALYRKGQGELICHQ